MASEKWVLRLMRFLTPDGRIRDEGVDAIVAAVGTAAGRARELEVEEFLPIATSAIREATGGDRVLERVAEETGVRLQVLPGDEEARLTFLAARRWYGWSAERILLFDIGGGSLEITCGADEDPEVALSLPLGAGRTTLEFLPDDPPTEEQLDTLREHARAVLREQRHRFSGRPAINQVVGTSKTIRSLARLAGSVVPGVGRLDRSVLSASELADWVPRLARIPAAARPELPGITTDRAFQIVAGGVVLQEAMRVFDVDTLDVCPWAMREGVILRYLEHLG